MLLLVFATKHTWP